MLELFNKIFKNSPMNFIPQIQPWIDNRELIELKKVIDSTYISENKLNDICNLSQGLSILRLISKIKNEKKKNF